ncbi:hypothetical protein ACG83_10695 [Frankia sp. R43]|uniref:hypothetical protein n=1 Tax=Frankia sp. R43 TaxID=269536 RepID=UPI0006CA3820|nr:hypothetical protein [Frankia sp. R43]KPM55738.1 hypothetical protein ACG83_10695 [Frankia sp. R43]
MPWAEASYTEQITGVTVTDGQLTQAQAVIDLYSGTTEEAAADLAVRPRDVRHLRMAVAYQAAWMASQVDVFSRTDVTSLDQDGLRAAPASADAWLLAPLADRALRRLSWRRMRSARVAGEGQGEVPPDVRDALARRTEVRDHDDETWTPL